MSISREDLSLMVKTQTALMQQLNEENAELRNTVTMLAKELDNTLNALICKESYQDEYLDENLSRLEFLIVKHSNLGESLNNE